MHPIFSIVIPLYNKANFIANTLQHVLNQSEPNFEVIVVNDGSTDASLTVVEGISDSRISIYSTENQGVSAARNFGIQKAKTDYIVFLDADDFWYPNHLENLKTLLNAFPNCGLYASAYAKKQHGKLYHSVYNTIPQNKVWQGIVADYFKASTVNNLAWTSATMVPKKILDALGGFNEAITFGAGEDTDLWLRIALKHPVAFSNRVTAIHNLQAENRISHTRTNLRRFINFDQYETAAKQRPSLKTYLDINRFAIGIQHRINGQEAEALSYFNKISVSSLNKKQRFLMRQNKSVLVASKKLQHVLQQWGIYLRPFK
ncbi:glycosyltransferase family 2 protein [Bizionia sediminis]|uniref:Glycosyltransferase family 2 protein n=1 Tax=Bizionia sediminis TaxID=1737064 RepID=A0ABW5KWQ7_9FLAO